MVLVYAREQHLPQLLFGPTHVFFFFLFTFFFFFFFLCFWFLQQEWYNGLREAGDWLGLKSNYVPKGDDDEDDEDW